MPPPNFTRKPVPSAAPAAAAPLPTFTPKPGAPPLKAGEVYVSDYTRSQLEPLGWQPGDPIPADLGSKLTVLKKARQQELAERLEEMSQLPPLVVPADVDIKDLPQSKQDELRQMLAKAKDDMKISQAAEAHKAALRKAVPKGADPSIQTAIEEELVREQQRAMAAMLNQPSGVTVIDDREEAAAAPPPAPPPPVAAAADDSGANSPLTHCPRCRLDMRLEYTAEPSEDDKQQFLVSVLNGSRFMKRVLLFDGRMYITFRSLTSLESTMVMTQMRYDLLAQKIAGEAEYYAKLMLYRLALSVAEIGEINGAIHNKVPPIGEIPYTPPAKDEPPETALVPMLTYIDTDVLTQESLRRMVGQHHSQFQRIVEALEAVAGQPDFWKGIAPQR